MPNLEDAILLATEAHKGKADRHGAPFILHPLRVMLRLGSETEQMAGVLHDVVEKTSVTLRMLRSAGYPEAVVDVVDSVTRREGESYEEFVERSAKNPIARRVKIADLEDNIDTHRMSRLSEKDAERLDQQLRAWRKVREAGE